MVYWKADFEEGNFYDITDAGYGSGGQTQVDSPYSSIAVESNNVFQGNYACKSQVITPPPSNYVSQPSGSTGIVHAKALRWNPIDSLTETYYGAALYLSPGFSTVAGGANSWVNIMQIHGMSDTNALPAFLVITKSSSGTLLMNLDTKTHDGTSSRIWSAPAIVGQWFTAVFYLRSTTNGELSLWINGQKVADHTGDYTMGGASVGGFFDTGIYQSYLSPAQYVLSDDMIVASTLEAATPIQ